MSAPSSSVEDAVSDPFPAGLRVLLVDDDPTCLTILDKMLTTCLYQVTKCNRAEAALSLLRENRNGYDVVISDVHMPDMDGFKFLEQVRLLRDLPVIMISADDRKSVVIKGVTHGACDYLIKPVRMEALKNIWQHVVRKKKHELKDNKEVEQSGSVEDGDRQHKPSEDVDYSSSANEGNSKSSKKRKDKDDNTDERDEASNLKKARVVWSVELHQQFLAAVNQLGIDKAVPMKIKEVMRVPGLTRENIASHLQKFRLYLRRVSDDVSQIQVWPNNSFMCSEATRFGSVPSMSGFELQAVAASGQLPLHSLATLQASALGRSTKKSAISMPVLDQRHLSNFGASPNTRFGDGQHQMSNNSNQMSLLHGMPSNMDTKQLANLNSAPRFACMNAASHVTQSSSPFMQMNQQGRRNMIGQTNDSQVPKMQSSMGQNFRANAIPGGLFDLNGLGINAIHNPFSQASSLSDLAMNQNTELPGNGFPFLGDLGMPTLASKGMSQQDVNSVMTGSRTLASKGMSQQDVNSVMTGSRGFIPRYDRCNNLDHQKPHDRGQNVRSMFDVSQHSSFQGTIDGSSSRLPQHPNAQNNKGVFTEGDGGHINTSNMNHLNPFVAESSTWIKSQGLPYSGFENNIYSEQCLEDDRMSGILEQQQYESAALLENDFAIDGFLEFEDMKEDEAIKETKKEVEEENREGKSNKTEGRR